MGTPNLIMPISDASAREVDIVPTWRYANCYPQSLQLLEASHKHSLLPQVAKLITHRFEGIEKVPSALRTACLSKDDGGNMVVKVAVVNSV